MNPSVTTTSLPPQLAKFPEEAREAYLRYQSQNDPASAQVVVLAVLQDFAPRKMRESGAAVDSLRLIEDLGFDSLAIAETVFFIEDLFAVKITNEDLIALRTVGELQQFVVAKLTHKIRQA